MDFDATAASTLQQAPTIPLKLLLVSMRQPPASLHARGIERRSWPSAAARAGRPRGRRPRRGGGVTLPGAAMADPSQEEAPAAAEPAGDGRPCPGRPPRHRPQSIRSAILRCSVLELGVMTASWMRMKMTDFVAEIDYLGYIQFMRTRKKKNHVLTYGVNHFLFLTSSAHGVAGRPHILCSGYS
jgi:hypothetical protein